MAQTDSSGIPNGPAGQHRIGVVVPYDMALDRELWRWTPPEASLFFTRTPDEMLPVTLEMTEKVGDPQVVLTAARSLRSLAPVSYFYACTSGSFVRGLAAEQHLVEALRATGAPAATASGAVLTALAYLNARLVSIATPYDEPITRRLVEFLGEAGVTVAGEAYLNIREDIPFVPYHRTAELIRSADRAEAEAIVVSCTNLPTYDLIAPLEDQLGKPIITANQAGMWAALRNCGLDAVGPGQRLLGTEPTPPLTQQYGHDQVLHSGPEQP
ncbi:aspartate/glutamate racemase family protein [Saxibacter everestensis]|uniref:Aspartate/glutamate racemase family protein n=1 Tax=Saxibacter everestensis TaxID=2909229 RepID=A0ABY8QW76_9MICO|nr:aspartate/glutamate racemase family protein [Brevibacteriaceae bacterium ZFBP1038]